MIRNMLINYTGCIRHSIILKIVCFDLPELYAPRPEDYNDFDVRDCVIESWQYYPDILKKRWLVQLLEDKKSLQRQIIELKGI